MTARSALIKEILQAMTKRELLHILLSRPHLRLNAQALYQAKMEVEMEQEDACLSEYLKIKEGMVVVITVENAQEYFAALGESRKKFRAYRRHGKNVDKYYKKIEEQGGS